jgi:hypothetical protein
MWEYNAQEGRFLPANHAEDHRPGGKDPICGSSAAPVITASTGTVNGIELYNKHTAVSGVVRGLLSSLEFSGTNVGAALNSYAIRGYVTISGTITGGSTVYATGVQGKCKVTGTMTGGRLCGVLAQIDSKGAATISGGEIAGLWIDNQFGAAVGAGNSLAMIHMETSDATINADCALQVYGKMTNFIYFEGAYSDYVTADATAFSGLTASFKVKCSVGGTPAYIHMTTA